MQFHDPSRPRTAVGLPCWEGTTIDLPDVQIWPLSPQDSAEAEAMQQARPWRVRLMGLGHTLGCVAHGDFSTTEIVALLNTWKDDPEFAIRHFFGKDPPREQPRTERQARVETTIVVAPNISIDDF